MTVEDKNFNIKNGLSVGSGKHQILDSAGRLTANYITLNTGGRYLSAGVDLMDLISSQGIPAELTNRWTQTADRVTASATSWDTVYSFVNSDSATNNTQYNQTTFINASGDTITGKLLVEDDVRLEGSLSLDGHMYLSAAMYVENDSYVMGDFRADGDVYLATENVYPKTVQVGATHDDNIIFTAEVDSDFIPRPGITYNLGTSVQQWSKLFVQDISASGSVGVENNVTIGNNLTVSGNTTLSGTLHVDDATYVYDTLDVELDTRLHSDLYVTGNTTVSGNTTLSGTLHVDDDSIFESDVHIKGDLRVDGNAYLSGGVDGIINVGDKNTDNVVFHADIDSGLTPNNDITYDLGKSDQQWRALYVQDISATRDVTIDNNLAVSGNTTVGGDTVLSGHLSVEESAEFEDDVKIKGDLTVDGNVWFNANNVDGDATIYLGDGNVDNIVFYADVDSNILPDKNMTYDLGSVDQHWMYVYTHNLSAHGDINVQGISLLRDAVTAFDDVTIKGDLTVDGNVWFNANNADGDATIYLGDGNVDNIVFYADVDSNIIPDKDVTYTLGTNIQQWLELFVQNISATGDTTVDEDLAVSGTSTFKGAITALDDVTVKGDLTVDGNVWFNANNADGDATIYLGDDNVDNIVFYADVDSNIIPDKDITFTLGTSTQQWLGLFVQDITASGDTHIKGDLTVDGNVWFNANNADGDATIYLGDDNVDNIVFMADVSSNIIPNDNVSYTLGTSSQQWLGLFVQDITATGSTTIEDNLTVSGNTHILGDLRVDGNAYLSAGVDGVINVGDKNTDNVVFHADVDSGITPNKDVTYDLGTNTQQWRTLYVQDISATRDVTIDENLAVSGNTTVGGDTVLSGHLDVELDTRLHKDLFVTGNTTVSGNTTLSGTLDVDDATYVYDTLDVELDTRLHSNLFVTENTTISGNTTLSGTLDVDDATYVYDTLDVELDTRLHSDLFITGNTTVSGNTTLSGTLDVELDTRLHSNLFVTENTTVSGNTTLSGTLDVDDATYLYDTLDVELDTRLHSDLFITGNTTVSGNTTLSGTLHVDDDSIFESDVHIKGDLRVDGNAYLSAGADGIINVGDKNTDNVVFHADVDSDITPNKDVTYDLGTNTQQWRTLYVQDISATRDVTIDNNLAVSGNTTVGGDTVLSGHLDVELDTRLHSDLYVTGHTTVSGNTTLSGTLDVDDATYVYDTLDVELDTRLHSDLYVTGHTTVSGNTTLSGTLDVDDATYVYDTLDVELDTRLHSNLFVTENTTVSGNTTLSGTLHVGDDSIFESDVHIKGDLRVDGNAYLSAGTDGIINVGDKNTDNVVFHADVDSNIIPDKDVVFDLGTNTQQWRTLYVQDISATRDITIDNDLAVSGNGVIVGTTILSGAVSALDDVTIKGDLTVDGNVWFNANNADGDATIYLGDGNVDNIVFYADVDSNIIPDKDMTYDLGTNTQQWRSLYIQDISATGDVTVDDDLVVSGTSVLKGDVTALNDIFVRGDLTVDGNVWFNANNVDGDATIYLGDGNVDNIVFYADVDSNIIPDKNMTYDLGSVNQHWMYVYTHNLSAHGKIDVNDVSLLRGAVTAFDDVTVKGDLTVDGNVWFNANNADGDATIYLGDGNVDNIVFYADVDSNIIPDKDVTYTLGTSTQQWLGLFVQDITASGDTHIKGDLTVDGNVWFNANNADGDATIYLGDDNVDNIVFMADVSSNIIPNDDVSYTLGTSSQQWLGLFVQDITATGSTTIEDDLVVSGNTHILGDLRVDGNAYLSAGVDGVINVGDKNTDNVVFHADVDSGITPNLNVTYDLGTNTQQWRTLYVQDISATGDVTIDENLAVSGNTTVGGDTVLSGHLDVELDTRLHKDLFVTGNTTVSGNTTLSGTLDVDDATYVYDTLDVELDTRLHSNLFVTENTTVSGNTTLSGTLDVDDATYVYDTLDVELDTRLHKDLFVTGNTTVSGNTTLSGTLDVDDATYVYDTLDVELDTRLHKDLYVTGNTTVSGNTTLSGTLHVEDDSIFESDVHIKGDLRVDGNAYLSAGVDGIINVGDKNTDNVVFHADIDSGLTPNKDITYDLGTNTQQWRTLYVQDISATRDVTIDNNLAVSGNTTVGGDTVLSGHLDVELDTRLHKDLYVTGNTTVSGNTTLSGTLDVDDATYVYDTLDVELDTRLHSNLFVTENTTISGNTTLSGTLDVDDATYVYDTLDVELDTRLHKDLYVTGNTTVSGNTTLSGTLHVDDDSIFESDVHIKGDLRVDGNAYLSAGADGIINVGDKNTDNVVFHADVDSNITPNKDVVFDLGTNTQQWRTLYVQDISSTGDVTIDNNLTVSGDGVIVGTTILSGAVSALDDVTIKGDLTVDGNVWFNANNADGDATIYLGDGNVDNIVFYADVDSNIIPDDDVTYDLGTNTQQWRTLYVQDISATRDITVDNDLVVSGTSVLKGDVTALNDIFVRGDLTVDGNVWFNANNADGDATIYLGDGNVDNIVFYADVDSNIIPDKNMTYDLGSVGQHWMYVYTHNLSAHGKIDVNDISLLRGAVTAFDDVTIKGDLTVDGNVWFNANNADGDATIYLGDGNVDNVVFYADVDSNIIPDKDVTYTLGTSSQQWLGLFVQDVTASGDTHIKGDLTVDGNVWFNANNADGDATIYLGDDNVDNIVFMADVSSNIIPNDDVSYTLGTSSQQWLGLFVQDITATGSTTIEDDLVVSGNTHILGDLRVDGNAYLSAGVDGVINVGDVNTDNVVFHADIDSNLIPDDNVTYDLGTDAQQWRTLYVQDISATGDTTIDQNLTVSGNTTVGGHLSAVSGLNVVGDTTLTGALSVTNNTHLLSGLTVEEDVRIKGSIIVDGHAYFGFSGAHGQVNLGNDYIDEIIFQANVGSDINPYPTMTYDLGNEAQRWRTIYVNNINSTGHTQLNSVNVTGSVTQQTTNGNFSINEYRWYATVGISPTVKTIDTFDFTRYQAYEFKIIVTQGSSVTTTNASFVSDGTNVNGTLYGNINIGSSDPLIGVDAQNINNKLQLQINVLGNTKIAVTGKAMRIT